MKRPRWDATLSSTPKWPTLGKDVKIYSNIKTKGKCTLKWLKTMHGAFHIKSHTSL